jgi:hypothetical protein
LSAVTGMTTTAILLRIGEVSCWGGMGAFAVLGVKGAHV